jgi:glycosyltransferase involved in cell wall biosynthesis
VLVFADAQALQSPITVERGIGRYVTEFANASEESHPGVISGWYLRPDLPMPVHVPKLVRRARFRLQDDPEPLSPDIWHATSPFESLLDPVELLWPVWARGSRTRLVATLYDLIPLLYPERYLSNRRVLRAYSSRLHLIERADRVLAISDATAADATRLLGISPKKIDVVGTGVSGYFAPPATKAASFAEAKVSLPSLRAHYVMYTGGIDFRKNIDGLLLGYSRLPGAMRKRHQLVIVCRMQDSERLHLEQQARALGVEQDLLLTGFVTDQLLLALYQAAELFVFPSLYEGFGLPVVEALACGVPALVGANSSLTELVPDARAHFDATSPDSITRALFAALSDPVLRRSLIDEAEQRDYRWSVVAERCHESYAAAVTHTSPVSIKPRLALITPMPPAASGVADYSMALLESLRKSARIDVFTQPDAHRPMMAGVEWYSYSDFEAVERMRGTHAERVFALGNSEHHIEPLKLLRAKGGVVMAHDVRYTGLLGVMMHSAPDLIDEATRARLEAMYEGRRPPAHADHASIPASAYYTLNGLMCEPVLGAARRILVHSHVAAMMARANLPASMRPRVEVVPFGHTVRPEAAWSSRDVVASFGIVHVLKESDTVCAAFIQLAERFPHITFALVGEVVDCDLEIALHETIRTSNMQDRVVLTGRVDSATYSSWLARTRIAVQLRAHSNGENSAAAADCLGAGAAMVASNTGAMSTLGDVARLVEPRVGVSELVDVVAQLVEDNQRAEALAKSGRDYALANSFEEAAAAVANSALGVH